MKNPSESATEGSAAHDSSAPAIPQAGRAKFFKQKDNTLRRLFCDCGQKAVTKRGNQKQCQRCADLCTEGDTPWRTGRKPLSTIGAFSHVEITEACRRFFVRVGLNPCGL